MSFAEWEPSAAAMDGRGGCGNLLGARLEVIANGETALRGRAGCEMNPSPAWRQGYCSACWVGNRRRC